MVLEQKQKQFWKWHAKSLPPPLLKPVMENSFVCEWCDLISQPGKGYAQLSNHMAQTHTEEYLRFNFVMPPSTSAPPPPLEASAGCSGCTLHCRKKKAKITNNEHFIYNFSEDSAKKTEPENQETEPESAGNLLNLTLTKERSIKMIEVNKPIQPTELIFHQDLSEVLKKIKQTKELKYECDKCNYQTDKINNLKRHKETKSCQTKAVHRKKEQAICYLPRGRG